MPVRMTLDTGRVPVRIYTDEVDAQALVQLANVARLPIVHGHIAAMPDVHVGIGATVGSVIPTKQAIIPAAVGVDIGCGMNAVRLSLTAAELPDSLARARSLVEAAVPVGGAQHRADAVHPCAQDGPSRTLARRLAHIAARHPDLTRMQKRFDESWRCQLGSLGGGNHFIELCLDESQRVWVMLHSGSRGIGNCIGRHFIAAARRDMERHQQALPDRDLAYLREGSELFDDYVEAVDWAQAYAYLNRQALLDLVLGALARVLPPFRTTGEAINCHHNYVAIEEHFGERLYVTRKGAISARLGEPGIIPGSMGARSFVVRGLGNPESLQSCAHGAGRRMSRTEAKRRWTREDLERQTQGVECRKDAGVIDEIPGAYKDIDTVMANQDDLVEVVHTLKQVLCIKG